MSEEETGPPATGERPDHHNSVPGEEIPGGAGTDPARRDGPDSKLQGDKLEEALPGGGESEDADEE